MMIILIRTEPEVKQRLLRLSLRDKHATATDEDLEILKQQPFAVHIDVGHSFKTKIKKFNRFPCLPLDTSRHR